MIPSRYIIDFNKGLMKKGSETQVSLPDYNINNDSSLQDERPLGINGPFAVVRRIFPEIIFKYVEPVFP